MTNQRILIIDDEPDIRDLYHSFLEDQDYLIDEAENGQQAFQLASKQQYDLYITDIMMPEMNGVEFIKVLKIIDPDAIVIIVTGYDDMHYTRQALEYGAFRYLTKPINMKEFKSIIELGLLERKKLFHSSSAEKLKRLNDKLNNNPELHQKVYAKMQDFLVRMKKIGATLIEIGGKGANNIVWARIKNKFGPINTNKSFSQDEINIMILSTLSQSELDTLLTNKSLKFNFDFEEKDTVHRFRFSTFFERGELVVCIKPSRTSIIPIEKIRLTNQMLEPLTYKRDNAGLVLVTGTSGSGKSSFIDCIINYNNKNFTGQVQIIQESPEFYHHSIKSLVRHIEIGTDVNSICDALENAILTNPKMIVIDEITSYEVFELVLKLIDSGVLVFSTMRTKSVIESLFKVFSIIPSNLQNQMFRRLAMSIKAIITLQLATSVNGELVLLKEIMFNNSVIMNTLVNGNFDEVYQMILQGKNTGMQTMEQDVFVFLKNGIVSKETALDSVNNINQFKDMVKYR